MAEYTEEYAHTRSIKNNEYYYNSSIQRSNTVQKHREEKLRSCVFSTQAQCHSENYKKN